jgi:PAS domain S-box-containing protein
MSNRANFSFPLHRNRGALKIAGIYLIFGALWILFSDSLVGAIAVNPAMHTTLSVLKGWLYVLVTAALLYWLIRGETIASRDRETQLRLVTDTMPALIAYIDAKRRLLFANLKYREWFGLTDPQAMGKCIENALAPEIYQSFSAYLDTAFAGSMVSEDHQIIGQAGKSGYFHSNYIPDFDREGVVRGLFVLTNDITARKRVESEREQLLAENQRQKAVLDAIFEADPSGLAVLAGRQMHIVYANPAYRYMTPDITLNPVGQSYSAVWPPNKGIGYHDQIRQVLDNGRPFKSNHFERIFPDRTRRIFKFHVRRIEWDGQPACLLTLWDVTEQEEAQAQLSEELAQRRQAETALAARNEEIKSMTQQLWQASKMVTMGELAASVAHEINNPLAILSLRVESLETQLPDTFLGKKDVEIMGIEIERMASLVSNLLQFSRSGQRHLSSLNVREELDNTLELVHSYLVHRHIEVREETTPSTPLVIADRQQMRQLFLNLITNASDAMPEGGTLKVDIHPRPDGSQVMIELQDTGVGIDPRDLPRVVEPFFTTKPEGKGTGLGLAICRRIVEEHQGSFQVTSPGKDQGVTVRMSLPCSHPETSLIAETEIS